jgi:TetR/AcrR family transcriptional repressor of mexJK operon
MAQDTTKEDLILLAARKRFAYYGFSKVTMDEIAGDVGLAKPSLYYYYPTKEHLFRAVIAGEHAQFVRDLDEILSKESPASNKLRAYAGERFRLFRELVNLNSLSFRSWSEVRSMSGDLFKNLEAKELKAIQRILKMGNSAGEFVCPHPHQTATLLLHLLHGLRLRIFREEEGRPVTEEAYADLKKESDLVVDLVLNALRTHH